jgi:hypothetical protein
MITNNEVKYKEVTSHTSETTVSFPRTLFHEVTINDNLFRRKYLLNKKHGVKKEGVQNERTAIR